MTASAIRSSLLLMTVLSALAVSGQAPKTGHPAALSRPGANAPFFLSAESASDEKGGIRWDAFDSGLREVMQAETARKMSTGSGGPCPVRIITFDHSGGDFRRLDEIVAGAAVAYRAHVISVTPGFESMTPVSLLGIEIDKVPRPNKQLPSAGMFYVIYPQADFAIGGVRFCNVGPIDGLAPVIGDQLLLFGFDPPITGENYRFLLTRPQHLVFSRGESSSLDDIEKRVIAANR